MKLKLTIADRLVGMEKIYPPESSIQTQLLVKDIRGRLAISTEERKKIGFRQTEQGFQWQRDSEKPVEFGEAEIEVLKARVEKLDKDEKVSGDILELCQKIRKAAPDVAKPTKKKKKKKRGDNNGEGTAE